MKISVFLMFICIFQVFADDSYSQTARISLSMSNATVEQVLEKIEAQSEFYILYNQQLVDVSRKVDIQVANKKIKNILTALFKGTDVEYLVLGRQIILSPKDILNEGTVKNQEPQQSIEIKGAVTDEKGDPLPGVNIVIKGISKGTVTDADGNYTTTVDSPDAVLVFSFVGYKSQEIPVAGKSLINVKLTEEAIGLQEVVAVGYGFKKKINLTGSVATVKDEELGNITVPSTTNTLFGRIPGLISKQTSGEPGFDEASLNIRGFGKPLIVVDGVSRGFNNIDPSEIASISVLKDASAAIYGARAGNGVILVTTKRGKIQKPTIKFNSSYTLQGVTKFPKPLNAGQYSELMNEVAANDGNPLPFTEEEVAKYYQGDDLNYPNTIWWDVIMRDWSPMQKYDLSLSGGSDRIRYYSFLSYLNQETMLKSREWGYSRYNIRTNIDMDITKNLMVSVDLSGILNNALKANDNANTTFLRMYNAYPIYPSSYPDKTKIPYIGGGGADNIIIDSRKELGGYNEIESEHLSGSLGFNLKIPFINGLAFKGHFDYYQNTSKMKQWHKKQTVYTYDYETSIYTEYGSTGPTFLSEKYSVNRQLTGNLGLTYERTFNEIHQLSGLLIYEQIDQRSDWLSGFRKNYLSSAIDLLFAGGEEGQLTDGSALESGRKSYVGRINYSLKGKYLAEITTRMDGSAVFPPEKRWGIFPSASLAWRISEESFLSGAAWIDNLKLRASIANTGYDATGGFQYLTGFHIGDPYIISGASKTGIVSTGLANPNITWEKMRIYNTGLDFSFWNGQLFSEIDAFYREREGILATRIGSLPNTFGATLPAENINSMDYRGFEFLLGHANQFGQIKYRLSANLSYARSKWDHYEEPEYKDPDQIRINQLSGRWSNLVFGYMSDGLFSTQEEIDNLGYDQDQNGNTTLAPGDVKFVDINSDGVIDWRDQVEIGVNNIPEIIFGINTNLKYKNLEFSMLWQGASRSDFQIGHDYVVQTGRNVSEIVFNERWTSDKNDSKAIIPRQATTGNVNNMQISDYWMVDASYLRLKQLYIGYSLPISFMESGWNGDVKVYFSGTNLLTFAREMSKYGFDPESPNGTVGWYYPQQRTLTFGANLTF